MFDGQIERELLDGEPWLINQPCKLPFHIQLLVDQQQGKKDIWESPENHTSSVKSKLIKLKKILDNSHQ